MSAVNKLSDQELVALLNQGSKPAYTEIYHRYHAALYIHVFNKIKLREESRDIVHDLFASLWNRRETLALKTTLAAYLYTAARFQVFDLIGRRKLTASYLGSISDFADRDQVIADHLIREKQLQAMIDWEIAALPPKMREIFQLSRKGHLSHRAIAQLLGLSEQTVKKQVNNSLKILRGKLGTALFTAFFI